MSKFKKFADEVRSFLDYLESRNISDDSKHSALLGFQNAIGFELRLGYHDTSEDVETEEDDEIFENDEDNEDEL